MKFQKFYITWEHVKGKKNELADALSRYCQPVELEVRRKDEPRIRATEANQGEWTKLMKKVLKAEGKTEGWDEILQQDPGKITSNKQGLIRIKQGEFWKTPVPRECAVEVVLACHE